MKKSVKIPTSTRQPPLEPPLTPPFLKEKIEKNSNFTKKNSFEVNILCKKMNLVLNCLENPFAFDVFY